jgi:hypothetical protein
MSHNVLAVTAMGALAPVAVTDLLGAVDSVFISYTVSLKYNVLSKQCQTAGLRTLRT